MAVANGSESRVKTCCDQIDIRSSSRAKSLNGNSGIGFRIATGRVMAKPILLSVDDDSHVLRAVERDLRSKYGGGNRVIGSDSPQGAIFLLKQLKVRNDSVALLLADQRMPRIRFGPTSSRTPLRLCMARACFASEPIAKTIAPSLKSATMARSLRRMCCRTSLSPSSPQKE
jgi:hypothetical protein